MRRICIISMLFGFAIAFPELLHAQTADSSSKIVVVVNASVPVQNLSMIELREIVLGQRRFWPNGERIELVVKATACPSRKAFVESVSGMTEPQFQHYWTSLIFSHRATRPPRNAPDRRLALALVKAIPGALTMVEEGELPDNVRIITIEGLVAGSSGYPL